MRPRRRSPQADVRGATSASHAAMHQGLRRELCGQVSDRPRHLALSRRPERSQLVAQALEADDTLGRERMPFAVNLIRQSDEASVQVGVRTRRTPSQSPNRRCSKPSRPPLAWLTAQATQKHSVCLPRLFRDCARCRSLCPWPSAKVRDRLRRKAGLFGLSVTSPREITTASSSTARRSRYRSQ